MAGGLMAAGFAGYESCKPLQGAGKRATLLTNTRFFNKKSTFFPETLDNCGLWAYVCFTNQLIV
jgi:hypothetical protein